MRWGFLYLVTIIDCFTRKPSSHLTLDLTRYCTVVYREGEIDPYETVGGESLKEM